MACRKKEGLYYDSSMHMGVFKVSEWLSYQAPQAKIDLLSEWMSDMHVELTNALVEDFVLMSRSKLCWMSEKQIDEYFEFKIGSIEQNRYESNLKLPSFEDRFKKFLKFHNDLDFNPPENLNDLCKAADDKRAEFGIEPLPYEKIKTHKVIMKSAVKTRQTLLN